MMDFTGFTYPYGYVYFNESLVWHPVAFAYSFLISGADLFLLAAIAYFSKKMTDWIPIFLITGLSFFSVVLLGPLAEAFEPHRAWRVMLTPHIFSSQTYPGISVMAVYGGVFWILTFLLGVIATFLYMSDKNPKFHFLRADETKYKKYESYLKIVFIALIPFALLWSIYPSTLLVTQTWQWSWRNWGMLPAMLFSETFVTATASAIIVGQIFKKKHENMILYIHSTAALVLCCLILIQLLFWSIQVRGTMFSAIYSLYPLFVVAFMIFGLTAALSLIAVRKESLVLWIGILAILGVILNKWNIIINAQLVSMPCSPFFGTT